MFFGLSSLFWRVKQVAVIAAVFLYFWEFAGNRRAIQLAKILCHRFYSGKSLGRNNINICLMAILSGATQVSQCQKGKPVLILLKQKTVSGSGIIWAVCTFAPRSRQITVP